MMLEATELLEEDLRSEFPDARVVVCPTDNGPAAGLPVEVAGYCN